MVHTYEERTSKGLYNKSIMSWFSSKIPPTECGAVIDIGSGSVGVALVVSNNETNAMDVVWSYREYMRIKDTAHSDESLRDICTTIVNALLVFGSAGLKALHEHDTQMRIRHVQLAICAPWSYTITKTINYENENNFEVNSALITQLVDAARKQTLETSVDDKLVSDLGLRMITDATVNVQLNGYSVKEPRGMKATSVQISHVTAVAQEKILLTLEESIHKILPKVTIEYYSFMYLFYRVLRDLHPDTSEICLIDVTNEATEIGIVRDNVLRHTTHTPFGMYSLAREIAAATGIPKEEAFTVLKNGEEELRARFSDNQLSEVMDIFEAYEDKIADLFKRTGDALSIPRSLFLHTSKRTEEFFANHLKDGAKKATSADHTVHHFTSELLGDKQMEDTALALSAYFFHTRESYSDLCLEK